MLDIFLIRHAESHGNVNHHLIGGRSDHFPLTEHGKLQAQKLGERLVAENLQFDQVFSSVAIRAQETARIVCKELAIPHWMLKETEELTVIHQESEGSELVIQTNGGTFNYGPMGLSSYC